VLEERWEKEWQETGRQAGGPRRPQERPVPVGWAQPLRLSRSGKSGRRTDRAGRLLRSRGTIYATVVESLKWSGDPYPGAVITDHTVRVPGFGKILFGELLINDLERRLTLLRLELGSPEGGDVACGEVQSNGIWP